LNSRDERLDPVSENFGSVSGERRLAVHRGPRHRRGVLHPFKTAFGRIAAMTALNARYKRADGEARHP
jgi:hypothetical protein